MTDHRDDLPVTLRMSAIEAHDVHHAIAIAVQLLEQVGAQPGGALTAASEERLARVARRLDHARHTTGARRKGSS